MCGPTGIGILYLKSTHAQQLTPAFLGGGTINTYRTRYTSLADCTLNTHVFSELPHKWIAGTPPIAETLGLSAAVNYLKAIGLDALVQHDQQLLQYVIGELHTTPGVILFGPSNPDQRSAIVSFNIEGLHPLKVGRILNEEFDIGLRAGHNCALNYFHEVQSQGLIEGNVRASFYLYNSLEEIERFLSAVKTIASTRTKEMMRR